MTSHLDDLKDYMGSKPDAKPPKAKKLVGTPEYEDRLEFLRRRNLERVHKFRSKKKAKPTTP